MNIRTLFPFALPLALACLMACKGGSDDPPPPAPAPVAAVKLHYVDPAPSTTAWRLVADSGNDTTHVVLKLLGPAGTATQGTAFILTTDSTKAIWGDPGSTDANAPQAKAGAVLNLVLGPDPATQMFKSSLNVAKGELQVGIFQKSGTAALSDSPLVYIALDMKPGTFTGSIPLSVSQALHVDGSAKQNITLAVGTLQAQ